MSIEIIGDSVLDIEKIAGKLIMIEWASYDWWGRPSEPVRPPVRKAISTAVRGTLHDVAHGEKEPT